MIRSIRTISAVGISLVALLATGLALAQQKYTYVHSTSPQSSRYVQQHRIDVGDVPGHQIRIFEVQNKYTRGHPIISGTRVVETWARGSSDYISGVGPVRGYGVWVLEDGNKIYTEWTGTTHSDVSSTGTLKGTFNGTTRLTGGTGKFAAIRGVVTDVVEFDTDPDSDYNNGSERGEYWFVQ